MDRCEKQDLLDVYYTGFWHGHDEGRADGYDIGYYDGYDDGFWEGSVYEKGGNMEVHGDTLYASKGRFIVKESGKESQILRDVSEDIVAGSEVVFIYNVTDRMTFLMELEYGGEFETEDDLPEFSDEQIGKVFHIVDDDSWNIGTPDSISL